MYTISIANMRSVYNEYHDSGGIKKYFAQNTNEEEKKRIQKLLIAWCAEVNKFYPYHDTIPFSHSNIKNLSPKEITDYIGNAYHVENRHVSHNIDAISQKQEWVITCKQVERIAGKIFGILEKVGELLQFSYTDEFVIHTFLNEKLYNRWLILFIEAIKLQANLRLGFIVENECFFKNMIMDANKPLIDFMHEWFKLYYPNALNQTDSINEMLKKDIYFLKRFPFMKNL